MSIWWTTRGILVLPVGSSPVVLVEYLANLVRHASSEDNTIVYYFVIAIYPIETLKVRTTLMS